MIDFNELKTIQDNAKVAMEKMTKATDELMKKLSVDHPELFANVTKDLHALRTTKDLKEVQEILNKYADKYNK